MRERAIGLVLILGVLMTSVPAAAQIACSGGTIALTIDDGPGPDTPALLAKLAANGLKATFFFIGQYVQAYPAIAQQVVAAGHAIGNHSWTHPVMTGLTKADVDNQILWTQQVIQQVTGVTPVYFRPPYGEHNATVDTSATEHGLTTALWTQDTEDYTGISADAIANQATLTQPGGIMLLHNWAFNTQSAIDKIGWYMHTYRAATPICDGKLVSTTNVMPVDDWQGQFFFVRAGAWTP